MSVVGDPSVQLYCEGGVLSMLPSRNTFWTDRTCRVNAGLTDQVEVLGERLSAVQLRFAKASTVARCFHAWRLNAAEVRKARSKNELAVDHARWESVMFRRCFMSAMVDSTC